VRDRDQCALSGRVDRCHSTEAWQLTGAMHR
jgi:hypothetical protein